MYIVHYIRQQKIAQYICTRRRRDTSDLLGSVCSLLRVFGRASRRTDAQHSAVQYSACVVSCRCSKAKFVSENQCSHANDANIISFQSSLPLRVAFTVLRLRCWPLAAFCSASSVICAIRKQYSNTYPMLSVAFLRSRFQLPDILLNSVHSR